MKTKVSPAIIGFFVLGAVALGVIALLSFGSLNLFNKPQRFVVYFDETIQGLDVGSPVKIRGVRIGRVSDVQIRHVAGSHQSYVAVICEMNRDRVSAVRRPNDADIPKGYEKFIADGLRAQLGVLGLATGMLYVELDFFDPSANPANLHPELHPEYPEIPSIPSTFAQFQKNVSDMMGQLKEVKFGEIVQDVQLLLSGLRSQLERTDVPALAASLTQAGQSVRNLAESTEVKQAFVSLTRAGDRLASLMERVGENVDPLSKGIDQTLTETRQAFKEFVTATVSIRQFLDNQQSVGVEASQAFLRLGRAAETINRLADFLERNPTALLSGRPPETNRMPESKK